MRKKRFAWPSTEHYSERNCQNANWHRAEISGRIKKILLDMCCDFADTWGIQKEVAKKCIFSPVLFLDVILQGFRDDSTQI